MDTKTITNEPTIILEAQADLKEIEERYAAILGRLKSFSPEDKKTREVQTQCEIRLGKIQVDHVILIMALSILESEARVRLRKDRE